ncbi:insulinase family protein [Fulvivirgaceae bacterium PWU4]|uniref:Insulinase family protein n=1 Tax=Chryseosolibacter histidini TaxID=2782349 RepID=A0AAP2DS15_9BACT|nr:insulinase family protein [Chryseosolibacter histidini]MBT1701505.1 insulinase family protein [Chryseosolibacter histidini]
MNSKDTIKIFTLIIVVISTTFTTAQRKPDLKENDSIPIDSEVKIGRLNNGLTYYIRKNANPKGIIELRLIVKAGSYFEDEDQLELAHLTEHMAFEGTKNFPGDSVVNYAEKNGIFFGKGLTASTAGMFTSYKISVPSSTPDILSNSLLILREWAQDLVFEPQRIDAQRGAVLGEFRQKNGSSSAKRALEKSSRIFFNDLRLLEINRLNIENIRSFKHESLLRFYRDWYRPDLEAVIVVGDLDPNVVELKIQSLFSDLQNNNPREVKNFESRMKGALLSRNGLVLFSGPDVSDIRVEIFLKRNSTKQAKNTLGYFKSSIMDDMYSGLMRIRLESLSKKFNTYPINSYINRNSFDSEIDALTASTTLNDIDDVKEALKSMTIELRRIGEYGFASEELVKTKRALLLAIRSDNSTNSDYLANKFKEHFVYDKAAPSPSYELSLISRLIDEITLDEINNFVKEWINFDVNRDIVITVPECNKAKLPSEGVVDNWIREFKKEKLAPFKNQFTVPNTLLHTSEIKYDTCQKIVKETWTSDECAIKDATVTKFSLYNRVTVLLRTSETSDQGRNGITLRAYRNGGVSLYDGVDRLAARVVGSLISQSGVGLFNKFQLEEYLKEKRVRVSFNVNENHEQINASCAEEDLEIMFQLIHLYFVSPRKDERAFEYWRSLKKAQIVRDATNGSSLIRNADRALQGDSTLLTTKQLEKIEFENVWRIYKDRFSGIGDFTVCIAGNFDLKQMQKMLLKYLASLPAGEQETAAQKELVYTSPSKGQKTIYFGDNNRAEIGLFFPGVNRYFFTTRNKLMLDLLGDALYFKIVDRLRTKEGGVYTPFAYVINSRLSKDSVDYFFCIKLDTAPNEVQKMVSFALEEFRSLKESGPDLITFEKSVARRQQELIRLKRAGIDASKLADLYQFDDCPAEYLQQEEILKSITLDDIKIAANKFLSEQNFQKLEWLPEGSRPNEN